MIIWAGCIDLHVAELDLVENEMSVELLLEPTNSTRMFCDLSDLTGLIIGLAGQLDGIEN